MNAELWPKNVETLRRRGANFTWRRPQQDIRVCCPSCGGVLSIHESQPWHWCGGGLICKVHIWKFNEVVAALPAQIEASK
jgi:hypothetical protein